MINSRSLDDLHSVVADKARCHKTKCANAGIDLLITSTYRDLESQNSLWNIGRLTAGKIVTNAKAGQSWHNWQCAYDVVPMRFGKPVWGTKGADLKLWQEVGRIGKECGLEWAGDWTGSLVEFAHFQYTGGLTLAQLQAGKILA